MDNSEYTHERIAHFCRMAGLPTPGSPAEKIESMKAVEEINQLLCILELEQILEKLKIGHSS